MRITVANLKGGTAKTTSAVCLASLLYDLAPTALVDTDPQGSALAWAEAARFPFPTQAPPAPYETIHITATGWMRVHDNVQD